MQPEIRTTPIEYTLHGCSLQHDSTKKFGEEIMALLGRVWPVLKSQAIPNDGINRVVYDGCVGGSELFAGVVVGAGGEARAAEAGLERKTVRLPRYAVWKHVGAYHLIPKTGAAMMKAIEARGLRTGWPMIEVYGHWTSDESKLETETFVAIE